MNKFILILFAALSCVSLVFAAVPPDNILRPGWNNLWSVLSLGYGSASDTDVVPGMFGYTLKGWEVNICSQYVTNDLLKDEINGFSGVSTDLSKIYDTVATLNAFKTTYSENETLIEVSWYIQPKVDTIRYNLYMMKGTDKLYLAKDRESDSAQGETGYTADYYPISYTSIVLEYKDGPQILVTKIIEKN